MVHTVQWLGSRGRAAQRKSWPSFTASYRLPPAGTTFTDDLFSFPPCRPTQQAVSAK